MTTQEDQDKDPDEYLDPPGGKKVSLSHAMSLFPIRSGLVFSVMEHKVSPNRLGEIFSRKISLIIISLLLIIHKFAESFITLL